MTFCAHGYLVVMRGNPEVGQCPTCEPRVTARGGPGGAYVHVNGPLWTPQEDEILKRMYAEGARYAEISEKTNRPLNGVRSRIRNLRLFRQIRAGPRSASAETFTPGPVPRKWRQRDEARLFQFLRDGLSHREIGRRLNRTESAVQAYLTVVRHRDLRDRESLQETLE